MNSPYVSTCLVCALFRPCIRFSSDEDLACRLATNEVQLFDARDFSKGITHRFRVPGIAGVEISRTPGSHVAAFVPESKVCSYCLGLKGKWKERNEKG